MQPGNRCTVLDLGRQRITPVGVFWGQYMRVWVSMRDYEMSTTRVTVGGSAGSIAAGERGKGKVSPHRQYTCMAGMGHCVLAHDVHKSSAKPERDDDS